MKGSDGKPLAPELVEEIRRLAAMPDDTIDFSDIPEVTDFSGFKRRDEWAAIGRFPAGPVTVGRRIPLPEPVARIYKAVEDLEGRYKGRKFTPDGHLVGSIGEVIAAEAFGLELYEMSRPGHDAKDEQGRDVQIKLTAGSSVAMYAESERLLVLRVISAQEAEVVYDGPGAPAWNAARKMAKNGQRAVSLRQLRKVAAETAGA